MSEEIRTLTLAARGRPSRSPTVAVREGMRRLREDGLDKVKSGLTSIAEVARVTGPSADCSSADTGRRADARRPLEASG